MSYVINGADMKKVKNLGWLLRNWQRVGKFVVILTDPKNIDQSTDAIMIAYDGEDNPIYVTSWASWVALRDWVHRPVFRGLPLKVWGWGSHRHASEEQAHWTLVDQAGGC